MLIGSSCHEYINFILNPTNAPGIIWPINSLQFTVLDVIWAQIYSQISRNLNGLCGNERKKGTLVSEEKKSSLKRSM